jgi:uncharacterized protein (DUF2141 family)
MKKVFTTFATAAIMTLATGGAQAQNPDNATSTMKVRVSGIREAKGTIFVALGDYTDPDTKWIGAKASAEDARDGAVECILSGEIHLGATLYAFLDNNGNNTLDKNPGGIPAEGCAFGPIEKDADGTAIIKLTYFN